MTRSMLFDIIIILSFMRSICKHSTDPLSTLFDVVLITLSVILIDMERKKPKISWFGIGALILLLATSAYFYITASVQGYYAIVDLVVVVFAGVIVSRNITKCQKNHGQS
jgi:hypothetical protein